MKLIKENPWQYLSVKLPMLGAFLLLVLIPALQWALDFELIPEQYKAIVVGVVLPLLALIGKKIYQPNLHQIQSFAAVKNKDENLTNLFSNFRKLAGGSLSQLQVDKINTLISSFQQSSMMVSVAGIDQICEFEGLRLNAYDDGVGVWTIGFGTTIYPNGIKVKKGDTCTEAQAKAYMTHDLKKFELAVNSAVTADLNQNQFDALVSLAYNIGTNAFKNSTLVKKLNADDFNGAANQFDVWNKAGGKVMQGLVNRRAKEKSLFLSGVNS